MTDAFVPLTLTLQIGQPPLVVTVIPSDDGDSLIEITGKIGDVKVTIPSEQLATIGAHIHGTGTLRHKIQTFIAAKLESKADRICNLTASPNGPPLTSLVHVFAAQLAACLILGAFLRAGHLWETVPARFTLPPEELTRVTARLWGRMAQAWLVLDADQLCWRHFIHFDDIWGPLLPVGSPVSNACEILTEINDVMTQRTLDVLAECRSWRHDMDIWQKRYQVQLDRELERFVQVCRQEVVQREAVADHLDAVTLKAVGVLRGHIDKYVDEVVAQAVSRVQAKFHRELDTRIRRQVLAALADHPVNFTT